MSDIFPPPPEDPIVPDEPDDDVAAQVAEALANADAVAEETTSDSGVPIAGTFRYEDERYPVGYVLEVPGLGSVGNFETKEVDVSQVGMFTDLGYEWPESNEYIIRRGLDGALIEDEDDNEEETD